MFHNFTVSLFKTRIILDALQNTENPTPDFGIGIFNVCLFSSVIFNSYSVNS